MPVAPPAPATPHVERLDHLVLTVRDIDATCEYYARVLGLEAVRFGEGRTALRIGHQKINLHVAGAELAPHALAPMKGAGDFCLVTTTPMEDVLRHLESCGEPVLLGPVARVGALGPITSVYLRDPDGNLVEVARYDDDRLREG